MYPGILIISEAKISWIAGTISWVEAKKLQIEAKIHIVGFYQADPITKKREAIF